VFVNSRWLQFIAQDIRYVSSCSSKAAGIKTDGNISGRQTQILYMVFGVFHKICRELQAKKEGFDADK